VHWADQQFSKSRVKREIDLFSLVKNFRLDNILQEQSVEQSTLLNPFEKMFNDPLWEKQWYMVNAISFFAS
jgi:hypothetical protein